MTNMSGNADLSESAKVPQDFVTRLENETKFEEATKTNEEESQQQSVDLVNETKFEEAVETDEKVNREQPVDLVIEHANEPNSVSQNLTEDVIEPENETKFEESLEPNGDGDQKLREDFVVEPENETKFDESIKPNEDADQKLGEDFVVEPETKTKFEESMEPNEDADQKLGEDFVVEPETETKFDESIKPNEDADQKFRVETKFDKDLETNEKVDQKLPENFDSEQTNLGLVTETNEEGEKVPENFVGETEIEKKFKDVAQETKNEEATKDEMVETGKRKRKASEIMNDNDAEESKKPKNVAKKPKLEIDLTNPNFLKPFDLGWKRELVYRSITDGSKKNGDIYYYTPAGKKLRSMREVGENLSDDVTIENFTFAKKPLGLKDPQKEIVRNANSKPGVPRISTPKIKKVTPKPIKTVTPKPIKTVTPKREPEAIVTTTPLQKREVRLSTREGSKSKKIVKENIVETSTPKLPKLDVRSKKRKRTVTFADSTTKLPPPKKIKLDTENFFEGVAVGYKVFLNVFKYLNVKDLLNAGCVSKMWNFMANNQALWETVRMKSSPLHSCKGMVNTLRKNKTVHLDLSKVSLSKTKDGWNDFTTRIGKVKTLRKIDLYRCPTEVVDELCRSNPKLEVINAIMPSNSDSMKITRLAELNNLQELYLKASSSFSLTVDLNTLNGLKHLSHLSLTSIKNLNQLDLSAIGNLTNLKSLGLGECVDLPASFGKNVLSKLEGLKHLRLEKGQGNCSTLETLAEVKNLQHLKQLELINFDIKDGFDQALGECTQIKKLLLIPNYALQSSLTMRVVLGGVMRLPSTLTHFVWGITTQLIKTTEILVDQQNKEESDEEKKINNTGSCIPILKPVPSVENLMENASDPTDIQFVSLSELQKILLKNIPNTSVKMLKIPFQYTWKQSLQDW